MLVARLMESSRANGPGNRAVIWFQGCEARCEGCCNPEFQAMESEMAVDISPSDLANWFVSILRRDRDIRGLTLSGGEPLLPSRRVDLITLMELCHERAPRPFDTMAFSGYHPVQSAVQLNIPHVDMFIAGLYDINRNNPKGIVSSTNQAIVRDSDAFDDLSDDDLINGDRIIEIRPGPDGTVTVTGLSSVSDSLSYLGLE